MTAGRALWTWAAACVAGAALVLLAAGRDWFTVTSGARTVAVPAAELAPALGPAAWAALAAVVAVLATRGVWRRVVGVVIALCGAGVLAWAWQASRTGAALRVGTERIPMAETGGLHVVPVSAWPVVAGLGGLLLVGGGVVAALRGAGWPGMSDRYERRGPGRAGSGEAGRTGEGVRSERALWDAIDLGADPTVGPDDTVEPDKREQ
ncbi:Trp biosynthesis-associated membrane protein [Streptosporangium sp. NBC_01756]|uniref:Trp biosynthesis-associated membrane protein n=1 Tax=Streptosporangium sp. NBC_01756 TaxID=2975950 RepID=UPI002DD817F9|nr:Trp biosynthesis-associated membrane protein [Streptosporangium sp. NBC_01756]WSC85125.1 Trp biosynthesis-associated membrane protein [Streptosporangium sp. NBC_01756]